jgi:AraC family transcriptional regulator
MANIALFDFASDIDPSLASTEARSVHGGVAIGRLHFPRNAGVRAATAQLTLFMHETAPVDLSCRLAESDRAERRRVPAGEFHILPAARPFDASWSGDKRSLVIAFEENFVERVIGEAFDGKAPEIHSRIGLTDPPIEALVNYLRLEMAQDSTCSRLCLEYVGASLAVRLFETYGEGAKPSCLNKGGLGGFRRNRVSEFIDAHLGEHLSLAALAAEAGLSAHHFGKAFKLSFGVTPCGYVTRKRIDRAKQLLLSDNQPITEIAYTLGFSSHSHFTDAFRKATGISPSEFRRRRD